MLKQLYLTVLRWRPYKHKKVKIVYIMSFPRNDGHLIEQLEQQYHGMIIVLYTKNCQSYAASLNQKGIKTILFDKKTLLITTAISYLKSAPLIFVDNYFPELAILKKKQVVIQLWHANGALKQFGWGAYHTKHRSSKDQIRFQKVYDKMNYFIVNSLKMEAIFRNNYRLENAQFCHFGSPRLAYLEKLEIGETNQNNKILYAPTYREGSNEMMLVINQAIKAFSAMPNFHFYMKLHPSIQLDAIELPRNVSIWEKHIFESFSEIGYLITDYSSVVFEYMHVKEQPNILFFCPDLEKYALNPGIEPDFFEYLPGPLVENEKQLIVALSNFSINSYKDNITRINEEWNQYQSKETINKIVELVERILGGFCEK